MASPMGILMAQVSAQCLAATKEVTMEALTVHWMVPLTVPKKVKTMAQPTALLMEQKTETMLVLLMAGSRGHLLGRHLAPVMAAG